MALGGAYCGMYAADRWCICVVAVGSRICQSLAKGEARGNRAVRASALDASGGVDRILGLGTNCSATVLRGPKNVITMVAAAMEFINVCFVIYRYEILAFLRH